MAPDRNTDKDFQLLQLRFENQARNTPNKTAIIFKDERITFQCLNARSNQLANELRSRGVHRNCVVGVMVTRSIDMIFTLLGILKAGGAFLPIAHDLPKSRVNYMIENSECSYIVCNREKIEKFNVKCNVFCLEDMEWQGGSKELEFINSNEDLAYILYTSGSTGNPKGVMIEHKALTCFDRGIDARLNLSQYNRVLALTSISFDIFLLETLIPLAHGCCIVIASEDAQSNPKLIGELITKWDIDLLQMTPSRIQLLINYPKNISYLQQVRTIFVGGDILLDSVLDKLSGICNAKIYNLYGPTETCIWASISDLSQKKIVDIGKPLPFYQIYIIDEHNNLCEPETEGEICIAGDNLARGYVGDEELTNEKFVTNPFKPGEKMYRTGDLGEWMEDGNIKFHGRIDSQIKLNGYRIELNEIESMLSKYDGINQAVVVDLQNADNDSFLGCFIYKRKDIDIEDLKKYLLSHLPSYMVPNYYQFIEGIPETFNGKIDKKAVRMLYSGRVKAMESDVVSLGENKEIIEKLQNVIQSCFDGIKIEEINMNASLGELQMNSLSFVQLVVELEDIFQISFENEYLDYNKFESVGDLVCYISKRVVEAKLV